MTTPAAAPDPTSLPMQPASGPPRRSTRGAKGLVAAGAVALLLALLVGGLAARLFVQALPLEVLAADGGDGSGVVGAVPAGERQSLALDEGSYAVYLARPVGGPGPRPGPARPADHITVTAPDGESVSLWGPSTSGTISLGGTTARTVTGFTARDAGTYVVELDGSVGDDARLLLVDDPGFGVFFGGVMGTVLGVFVALGLGALGLGLGVGGGILWYRRTH